MNNQVYNVITDRIIAEMEKGSIPWKKSWKFQAPRNLVSKRRYNGINFLMLTFGESESPYWLTFNQARGLGGSIKAGEKGTPVIFWKLFESARENEDKEIIVDTVPYLQYYTVFNLTQTQGIKNPEIDIEKFDPIEKCESIVTGYTDKPEIVHSVEPRAYYVPSEDKLHMPVKTSFTDINNYYSALFHELTHSTGHEKRLNRITPDTTIRPFGSELYSKEELVAELGSAFLCAEAQIDNSDLTQNTAAYLQSWLKALKDDPKLIVHASAKASKAADYILKREVK